MTHEEIRDEMRWIPRGKVKTYSAITPSACAQVGKVQNEEHDGWHRVVFKDGRTKSDKQRGMLLAEGVTFRGGRVAANTMSDLVGVGWA